MKNIIKTLITIFATCILVGCTGASVHNDDISLYDTIRINTLKKTNYTLTSTFKTDRTNHEVLKLEKVMYIDGDKTLIKDTLIEDEYVDTIYTLKMGDKMYDESNNIVVENQELFIEDRAYLDIDYFLLDKENVVNVIKVDDSHLNIEYNDKINKTAEIVFRSFFHEAADGPKITDVRVNSIVLTHSQDNLLLNMNLEIETFYDDDIENGLTSTLEIKIDNYDYTTVDFEEEDLEKKPVRQYYSRGYVDDNGKLVSNEEVHPENQLAIAYLDIMFDNDEFNLDKPIGFVKLLDCSDISIDDYYAGINPTTYNLIMDDEKLCWVNDDTNEQYPYSYYLSEEYFVIELNGKNYFFGLEQYNYPE